MTSLNQVMNKCFLDSNILIYLKDDSSANHLKTVKSVRNLIKNRTRLFISPLCLDETIHSFSIIFKKDFEKVTKVIYELLDIPLLEIVNPPTSINENKRVLSLMKDYNLRPRDAYHLLTMQANNIDGFATFDNDFKKVFASKILQKA